MASHFGNHLWLVHTGVEVDGDKKSTATFCRLRFRRQCGRDFRKVSCWS